MLYYKHIMMNFIDYIMILMIFFFVYVGYNIGFLQELLTWVMWYFSYMLTNRYYYYFLSSIQYLLNFNILVAGPSLIKIVLYFVLFISFYMVFSYFKYWLFFLLYNSVFLLNRILGAFLGLLKGILFAVVVLIVLNRFLKIKYNGWWISLITDYFLRKIKYFFGIL